MTENTITGALPSGHRYLMARSLRDSGLAGLLDDLHRERRDLARCGEILRTIDDLAWTTTNKFTHDDAHSAARQHAEVSR